VVYLLLGKNHTRCLDVLSGCNIPLLLKLMGIKDALLHL